MTDIWNPFGGPSPLLGPDLFDMAARRWRADPKNEPFKLRLPDPAPHDLAEVWNNADAVVARTCQRCGKTFGPHQLAVHPDDETTFARMADREGYEVIVDPYTSKGTAIRMDQAALDFLGCQT